MGGSVEPLEPAGGLKQELTLAAGCNGVVEESPVELGEGAADVRQHAGVDERAVQLDPVARTDLRTAAVEDQRGEDPVVDCDLRLLRRGAQRQQDRDPVSGKLRPRRPEGPAVCDRADATGGRPGQAREQKLAFPAAALLRAPVDRCRGVGLNHVQSAADEDRRGARNLRTLREAPLRNPVRVQAPARVDRDQAEPRFGVGEPKRVGERRASRPVEGQPGRAERCALPRPRHRPELPAGPCEGEPRAAFLFDEDG